MSTSETDFLAGKALEGMNALSAKITTMAPMIWQKMVVLTQAESIAYLAVGGIGLLFAIVGTFWLTNVLKQFKISQEKNYNADPPASLYISLLFCVGYVPAAALLLYPWNWVGAFAPEARLIARLLGAVTNTGSH